MPRQLRQKRLNPTLLRLLLNLDLQILHQPTPNIINHAMNLQPTLMNPLNHIRILPQRLHPLPHIRLHQLRRLRLIVQPLPCLCILRPDFSEGHQPSIDGAEFRIPDRGGASAAGGVAAQHDVFYAEVLDGVLDHGE